MQFQDQDVLLIHPTGEPGKFATQLHDHDIVGQIDYLNHADSRDILIILPEKVAATQEFDSAWSKFRAAYNLHILDAQFEVSLLAGHSELRSLSIASNKQLGELDLSPHPNLRQLSVRCPKRLKGASACQSLEKLVLSHANAEALKLFSAHSQIKDVDFRFYADSSLEALGENRIEKFDLCYARHLTSIVFDAAFCNAVTAIHVMNCPHISDIEQRAPFAKRPNMTVHRSKGFADRYYGKQDVVSSTW